MLKKILLALNILLAIVYAIGCLLPWLSPQYFWWCSFIGFVFPYLAIAIFITALLWLFVNPKYSLVFLLFLACGYQQIAAVFAFNTNVIFSKAKLAGNIRIISFNVGNLSRKTLEQNAEKHTATEFVKSILQQNADIVCLQEFASIRETKPKEYIELSKKYKYTYLPGWSIGPYFHKAGNVIFSKFPIVYADSSRFANGENIIRADIVINEDTLSVFSVHFDSYKFSKEEFGEIDGKSKANEQQQTWKNIAKKVKYETQIHNNEATVVNEFIKTTSHPFVLCTDMNEIPNNYVYWKIRNNKQDAFLQKGFGFGKTYNSLSTPLRIDYIFLSQQFTATQFAIIEDGLSDHNMLVADIEKIAK